MIKKTRIKSLKKIFCFFWVLFYIGKIYSLSLEELTSLALKNNIDILVAQTQHDTAILSSKTLNGIYTPQIIFSSSSTLQNENKWITTPNNFSSSITYNQILPGGLSFEIIGGLDFSTTTVPKKQYVSKNPNIYISISQSLLPFWGQGKFQNPEKIREKKQEEVYYYQLLYTRKTIFQNLIQNLVYSLVYKNQIHIYKNLISLLDEEIELSEQLINSGAINHTKITELKNSRWNYQLDLINVQSNYIMTVQNLKSICGIDISENSLDDLEMSIMNNFRQHNNSLTPSQNLINQIRFITENNKDPEEESYKLKLEILKLNRILEKQSSAPTISISIQPIWTQKSSYEDNYTFALKDFDSPTSFSAVVNFNLSPLLSSISNQNKTQYELEYQSMENSYNAYIENKKNVLQQYRKILENYESELQYITELYGEGLTELEELENQYKKGAISKFEYNSVKVKIENYRLFKKITEEYIFLYEILVYLNA